MENSKKRISKRQICIYALYMIVLMMAIVCCLVSSFSVIDDTYGLSSGIVNGYRITGFFQFFAFIYIQVVNFFFLFLGEKIEVIVIVQTMFYFLAGLLVFLPLLKLGKKTFFYVVPACVCLIPFFVSSRFNFDGFCVLLFCGAVLFAIVLLIVIKITKFEYIMEEESNMESLSEIEKRENQKAQTIVNDKGETVTLLANPLPGPKKHVKRQMDYDMDVPEDKMHFDIEELDKYEYDVQ